MNRRIAKDASSQQILGKNARRGPPRMQLAIAVQSPHSYITSASCPSGPLNRSIGAHFHSGDVELSDVGEDFGEAIGEAVELLFHIAALERAAELFHDMLSSDEG